MKIRFVLLFLIVLVSNNMSAQKIKKVCGEYTYYAPENVSIEQARRTALDRAMLEALTAEFGTIVSQNNATVVQNRNGQSDVEFLSIGGSEVKGEWIETIGDPDFQLHYEQNMLVVQVSVCGRAREITATGVEFMAKLLRNGTGTQYESDVFRENDDLYLLFKSPVSGYLSVYLLDDSQTAYCLLPYRRDASGKAGVQHGKEYIFFSSATVSGEEAHIVDEYTLTCSKQVEHNQIYIIFSSKPFVKALDTQGSEHSLPRELPFKDFQQWLTRNRVQDKDMKVEIKNITIRK